MTKFWPGKFDRSFLKNSSFILRNEKLVSLANEMKESIMLHHLATSSYLTTNYKGEPT